MVPHPVGGVGQARRGGVSAPGWGKRDGVGVSATEWASAPGRGQRDGLGKRDAVGVSATAWGRRWGRQPSELARSAWPNVEFLLENASRRSSGVIAPSCAHASIGKPVTSIGSPMGTVECTICSS